MNNILYTNELFFKNFKQLEVEVVPHQQAVWLCFNPQPRSCFTLTLLKELDKFQSVLRQQNGMLSYKGELIDIKFNIIASRHPVFNYGGDLNHFIQCILKKDRDTLETYAKYCIDAIYYNHIGREFDITTISLINGDALGGGFEAALSSHVIIAERKAELGLPEVLFNLFPGMGAYNLLAQRISPIAAEKIILSGRRYSAEELHNQGVIDILVEDGEGKSAIDNYLRSIRNRQNSIRSIHKVRRMVNPIDYQQLREIGDIWVDTALELSERDLRIMKRLVRSQEKYISHETISPVRHVNAY